MRQPNLILTGFMGTGKTTVGKLLASRLGYRFVDTDAVITARAGMSVAQIFQSLGEADFRQREGDLAVELSQQQGMVIATGGKLLLDETNADVLTRSGTAFCLTAELETILTRVAADAGPERPLLAGPDPEARLAALLDERRAGYARFREIDTTGHTPTAVADAILAHYNEANSDT